MALTEGDINRIKEIIEPVNVKIEIMQQDTAWIKKRVGNGYFKRKSECLQERVDPDDHPVSKGLYNELRKDVDKIDHRVRNIALKVSGLVATIAALGLGGAKISGLF